MRNLGGSVGIAMLATLVTIREHFHFSVIGDRLTQNSLQVAQWVGGMTQMLVPKAPGSNIAHFQALAELANLVRREAYVMAYSDCFSCSASCSC